MPQQICLSEQKEIVYANNKYINRTCDSSFFDRDLRKRSKRKNPAKTDVLAGFISISGSL